ncbi:MAG: trehalose-6-phosphate synthase [Acidimicrobiales bacterium]
MTITDATHHAGDPDTGERPVRARTGADTDRPPGDATVQHDLVIAANRLPVRRQARNPELWELAPGGLVTALAPVMRTGGGAWIGWTGEVDDQPAPFVHEGISLHPVSISAREHDEYYEGLSNGTIWPLYHSGIHPAHIDRQWWRAYEAVNRRFAETIVEVAAPAAVVWIHDYHLQLVPAMVRARREDVRIGFFLHTPFPPSELFLRLPWRAQIAAGMLGADVIGFQTPADARHFASSIHRVLDIESTDEDGEEGTRNEVRWQDRTVRFGAHPISIDTAAVEALSDSEEVRRRSQALRRRIGSPETVLLGVDRLDYTKGIDARLEAYLELLREGALDPEQVVFIQIATPSRPSVLGYRDMRDRIERLVGEINGEFGSLGRTPVHYLRRNHSFEELVAYYRLADVMVVTPYRDGMNLVAKEYVASRTDDTGVLLLSEFAGTAAEFHQAILCNPFDVDGLKTALCAAIDMGLEEQKQRMAPMRQRLHDHTVDDWADIFLQGVRTPTRRRSASA